MRACVFCVMGTWIGCGLLLFAPGLDGFLATAVSWQAGGLWSADGLLAELPHCCIYATPHYLAGDPDLFGDSRDVPLMFPVELRGF